MHPAFAGGTAWFNSFSTSFLYKVHSKGIGTQGALLGKMMGDGEAVPLQPPLLLEQQIQTRTKATTSLIAPRSTSKQSQSLALPGVEIQRDGTGERVNSPELGGHGQGQWSTSRCQGGGCRKRRNIPDSQTVPNSNELKGY